MKNVAVSVALLVSALSAPAFATDAQVNFSGSCAAGSFDAVGNDIEYFDLGLELTGGATSAECVITTTLHGKPGLRINVSDFKAEGLAFDVQPGGIATLTVNHRFNQQTTLVNRAIAREDGPLIAFQQAVGLSACGEDVILRTKLAAKAVKAQLLQDSATSNTVSYRIGYVPCP